MEERHVTVDGVRHALPEPFVVVATQNPVEYEGTYPLPEAQLDRFLFRAAIGYPAEGDERALLRLARDGLAPAALEDVRAVADDRGHQQRPRRAGRRAARPTRSRRSSCRSSARRATCPR